jgi:hypothetical protein
MIVSNSNMKSIQKCEYKFYFDVKLSLRPKNWPEPVEKGLFGHDLMESFFQAVIDGADYDEAAAVCTAKLGDMLTADPTNMLLLQSSGLLKHVLAFGAYFFNQPWKILEVEKNENWTIDDEADFGYTPDLVAEWTEGPKRGLPFVLDYKFTGQYWNERQIQTVQQMLKYLIYYNKKHGTKMRHAGIVMLNTRANINDTGNKLFLVKWLPVSKTKLDTIERENEILVKRIEPLMRMDPEEYKAQAVHTTDELACKTCWFADDICPQDMNGQDISKTIEANYIVNDYGYN